ncbi:MAG: glycerophosphodiester phosphodiesterase [Clostridiales bacterium]|nr:glycerophosphodiester phosphodiesterase [Clostridiales bacterium]
MKNLDILKARYIAHRGLHNRETGVPENSMAAFAAAVDAGLPVEFDLHLLKDGQIVVFHDDNLVRMTGLDKDIKDCTYDEIKDLTLYDTEERIPLLEDVLRLADGKVLLDIELKTDLPAGQLEAALCPLLDAYAGAFVVKSFSPFSVQWFHKHRPDYIRGQLSCDFRDADLRPLSKFICKHMLLHALAKPDFIAYALDSLPNRKVARFRKRGLPVLVWTIRSEEELERAREYGDGFVCETMPPPSRG